MIRSVFLALALLGAPLGYAAPLASPYSLAVFPAQTFTASGQTGTAIQLNGLTVPSTVGSSFWSGTITVTGTSLTTATFGVLGSSDGGETYYPLPIVNPLAAPTSGAPATVVAITANGIYQISLSGITHVKFVTSGTFTATALSLTLTASPNASVSRNGGNGGSFTPPSGSGNQVYATPADGSTGAASLRPIVPADLPSATSSAQGIVKPDGTTCTVTAGVLTCTGGTGGGGSVGTGPNGAVGGYVNGGTGNGILPLPKLYYINQTMTLTQINAVFAAADSNSLVIIGNNVPQYAWNNVHDAQVQDNRIGTMKWGDWFARKGVVCDYRFNLHGGGGYTLTQGSNQLNIGADPYAVGSTMVFAQQVNFGTSAMIQNVWMPTIVSYTFPYATLSGPAPFNYVNGGAANGTDNYAALQAIFNEAGATFPVRIPDGCSAFTSKPLNWAGTTLFGSAHNLLAGAPGQDILQSTFGQSNVAGAEIHNVTLFLNTQINPAAGYRLYTPDGSSYTAIAPMDRPVMNNTSNANHPLSDQWVTNGTNGVASITSGSPIICIPTALGRSAANGKTVVFPYLPINAVFNSSVVNQTGTGCPGGNTGVTLAAAIPTLPANGTIIGTTFNEASLGTALAGTTPATCTNGCVGPWTLASGTDWTYQTGGGIRISTNQSSGSTLIGDTIDLGSANTDFVATWTISTFDPTGYLLMRFRQTTVGNQLDINIQNGNTQCYDEVATIGSSACAQVNGSPVGTYTLTLKGNSFTLVTPNGTTGGTTVNLTGTKLVISSYTPTAGPIQLSALTVTQNVYNYAQSYYESADAFETGNTGIGTTLTYPTTITVSLPNAPDPAGTSAPWGHVIIGNNSVRFEADYMGNNYSAVPGSGTFVLRRGPATITSSLTSGSYFIIPANPCAAHYATPPPVFPNINGGSSETPAGAVDIPGWCAGNAAMAFPEPNGTVPSVGLVGSVIGPVKVISTSGQINGGTALYQQANAAGYSVSYPSWKIEQLELGFAQGPASIHNWGVGVVGPTAAGNTFSDCQIFAAFPIVLSDFQQGNINRCDTYTDLFSPYDGTSVGAATALAMAPTTSEQNGGLVTLCSQVWVNNWNSEPENGSHIAIPAFAYVGCYNAVFEESNFEGALSIFSANNITVKNSQLSLPVINYGWQNKFENNYGINPFWVTNNWADNSQQWFNWGYLSECSEQSTLSPSMKTACGSGFYESYSGKSATTGLYGLDTALENEKGGAILPGEMGYATAFQGPFKDSTEPVWGSYYLCAQVGGDCQESYFGGPSALYIGQHNRIGAAPYDLNLTVKQTTGSATTFQILFGAFGSGCPGQFGLRTVPVTTAWLPQSISVDFTGKAGCTLQIQVQNLTNPVEIGEMTFVPQINKLVITPPSDSIYNTACPVSGTDYGVSATGYHYWCVAGTIKRSGPFS